MYAGDRGQGTGDHPHGGGGISLSDVRPFTWSVYKAGIRFRAVVRDDSVAKHTRCAETKPVIMLLNSSSSHVEEARIEISAPCSTLRLSLATPLRGTCASYRRCDRHTA